MLVHIHGQPLASKWYIKICSKYEGINSQYVKLFQDLVCKSFLKCKVSIINSLKKIVIKRPSVGPTFLRTAMLPTYCLIKWLAIFFLLSIKIIKYSPIRNSDRLFFTIGIGIGGYSLNLVKFLRKQGNYIPSFLQSPWTAPMPRKLTSWQNIPVYLQFERRKVNILVFVIKLFS